MQLIIHISARVARNTQEAFRNRKGEITTNALAMVDHNMRFTFVHGGWEGSAHDARVFLDAVNSTKARFPWPPHGKVAWNHSILLKLYVPFSRWLKFVVDCRQTLLSRCRIC